MGEQAGYGGTSHSSTPTPSSQAVVAWRPWDRAIRPSPRPLVPSPSIVARLSRDGARACRTKVNRLDPDHSALEWMASRQGMLCKRRARAW